MANIEYYTILRTLEAELKGYNFLADEVKDGIVPIIELTHSRRSKKNSMGSINRQIDKLVEIIGERKFILDLTTEPVLSNAEIDSLLQSPEKGFLKWRMYVRTLKENGLPNIIPMIHWNDKASDTDFIDEIKYIESEFKYAAFRLDIYDKNAKSDYLDALLKNFSEKRNLILIIDAGFTAIPKKDIARRHIEETLNSLGESIKSCQIIVAASCFPKSVVNTWYGNEKNGYFELAEVSLSEEIKREFNKLRIIHGDYAGIHPIKYQSSGGTWVPRIDVPGEKDTFYHRRGRDDGGYISAAQEVINDPHYKRIIKIPTWGDGEIASAAKGLPNGKSPSHWIAVRVNLHITRQYLRTSRA